VIRDRKRPGSTGRGISSPQKELAGGLGGPKLRRYQGPRPNRHERPGGATLERRDTAVRRQRDASMELVLISTPPDTTPGTDYYFAQESGQGVSIYIVDEGVDTVHPVSPNTGPPLQTLTINGGRNSIG
jgi:hypothetical protein